MKQQRLPYGHEPETQNVCNVCQHLRSQKMWGSLTLQISVLYCGNNSHKRLLMSQNISVAYLGVTLDLTKLFFTVGKLTFGAVTAASLLLPATAELRLIQAELAVVSVGPTS